MSTSLLVTKTRESTHAKGIGVVIDMRLDGTMNETAISETL